MQEGYHDIKNDQCHDTSGIRVCKCKKVVMTQKITDVMLLVRLEFVSARKFE